MKAYYNEIDPYAAQWLRNLIAAGHIAPGHVDERSIVDVRPADLVGFTQCHFFAGLGGWSHALRLAGWPDDRHCWTGSCPCQPLSVAGQQKGHADARHLWPAFHHLIAECRPATVFGEQVAGASGREWLAAVRTDLETDGYACGAADLCAAGVGAPHIRQRLYWMAYAAGEQRGAWRLSAAGSQSGQIAGSARPRSDGFWSDAVWLPCRDGKWRPTQPGLQPLAHGISARVGRLRAYGNAICAPLAAAFIAACGDLT